MEIFDVPRGAGKTTHLIIESTKNGYPIVVGLGTQKNYLMERASKITDKQVEVYTVKEILAMDNKPKKVLIDDLPYVLSTLLDCEVEEATMTSKSREMYDISLMEIEVNNMTTLEDLKSAKTIEQKIDLAIAELQNIKSNIDNMSDYVCQKYLRYVSALLDGTIA